MGFNGGDLLGKWDFLVMGRPFYFKLEPDGTFETDYFFGKKLYKGSYSLQGLVLIFYGHENGDAWTYVIGGISGNRMEITAADGIRMTWTRL